ncbi:MAG: lipid-A-disaccharide synthase [Planctomycetota bacterium]
MSFARRVEVTGVILREIWRAISSPYHALAYIINRASWQARAREALSAELINPTDPPKEILERASKSQGESSHIFISVGEASGEAHAVNLLRAVKAAGGETSWTCFGGSRLESEGAELLFPLSEQEIMGVGPVLRNIPKITRAFADFIRHLDETRPDLIVLIDYPGLHLLMAAAAKRRGIPVLHYIVPQYWAWAPWRMRRYRKVVDMTIAILPFEVAFFGSQGVPCSYVGHPLIESLPPPGTETEREEDLLVILPGSRRKEIETHLPGMLSVAGKLREKYPGLRVILPHRDPARHEMISRILESAQADYVEFQKGDIHESLRRAKVVLAKSGTGSLESCLLGAPTVVVYRVIGRFNRFVLHKLLNIPWFASANLIAGREIVSEFALLSEEEWQLAGDRVEALLGGIERQRCLEGLADLRRRLGSPGASARVARWILPFCRSSKDA